MIHVPVVKVAITSASSTLTLAGASLLAQVVQPDPEHYTLLKWLVGGLLVIAGSMAGMIWHDLRTRVDELRTEISDFTKESRSDRAKLHERMGQMEATCDVRHSGRK